MKRLVRIMLIVLLLVIIGGAVAFWQIKGAGSSKLEQWIGSQIQLIADSYLNPKLSFTDLDYEYPGTCVSRPCD